MGMSVFAAQALELEFGTAATGDGGRGFGILAEYGEGGPKTLTITRNTLPGNPAPDYWKRWGNLCNLVVIDPDGFRVVYLEMGDQSEATKIYTVKIPEGRAGLWRVSVSGGLCSAGRYQGDTYKVVVPDSSAWGVRGEKGLKLMGKNLPEKMYMAFVPSNDLFYLTGSNLDWIVGGQPIKGETGRSQHGDKAILAHCGDAEIVELSIDAKKGWFKIYADGIPNTLSPTAEMAKRLKGGAMQAKDGTWLEGPLQVKCRDYMMTLDPKEMDISGFLPRIKDEGKVMCLTNQTLNPFAKDYGMSFRHGGKLAVWSDFFHYGQNNYNDGTFSSYAAEFKAKAFIKRALLSGLADLSRLDACGILRHAVGDTRPLKGERIDCATMFEISSGIGGGYAKLKPFLSPEEDRLYREGVTQIFIKQQGFMCYQSNQFMHILEGFNEVFCATGDPILERCLKMQLKAFINNDFHGKHGQTAAGFFSEEYGPDGNYDQMNLRPMSVIYKSYREQPGADQELVAMMKRSIEKDLAFRALFAVPDPGTTNGAPYQLAYAMNHRTDGPTHFDSHGGLHNLSNEMAMAYTLLALGAPWRDAAKCVKLPYESEGFKADLPGFAVLKRGNFYGVQFWKVYDEGADGFLGPLFLWHTKAGMGLCGVKHSYGARYKHWFGPEMDTDDLTFATVYGDLDGKLYIPSRKMKKELVWNEKGNGWTVTGTAYQPPKDRKQASLKRGEISWKTEFVSDDAVEMEISVDFPDLKNAVVNLPMLKQLGSTVWSSGGWRPWQMEGNKFIQKTRGGTFTITFPERLEVSVNDHLYGTRGWALALRLKIPASGKVKVRLEASGSKSTRV